MRRRSGAHCALPKPADIAKMRNGGRETTGGETEAETDGGTTRTMIEHRTDGRDHGRESVGTGTGTKNGRNRGPGRGGSIDLEAGIGEAATTNEESGEVTTTVREAESEGTSGAIAGADQGRHTRRDGAATIDELRT